MAKTAILTGPEPGGNGTILQLDFQLCSHQSCDVKGVEAQSESSALTALTSPPVLMETGNERFHLHGCSADCFAGCFADCCGTQERMRVNNLYVSPHETFVSFYVITVVNNSND